MNAETRTIRWRNDHRPGYGDIRGQAASRGILVLIAVTFALLGVGIAYADDDDRDRQDNSGRFNIERATWDSGRQRLVVRGNKDRRATVRVVNAADPAQLIGVDNDRRDSDWRVRTRRPSPVPCTVRALSDDGGSAETAVRNAPSDCGGTNAPPIPNAPPTANAGPNQTVTLPPGFTNMPVTLNGGGSSDTDGTVTGWIWTGTPDPDDEASPTVMLGEGTHSFSLGRHRQRRRQQRGRRGLDHRQPANRSAAIRTRRSRPTMGRPPASLATRPRRGPCTARCTTSRVVRRTTRPISPVLPESVGTAFQEKGSRGINTYCGAHETSPRFTCAGCHVGNGRFPKTPEEFSELDQAAQLKELGNIDCLMCHQEQYKRFPDPKGDVRRALDRLAGH